MKKALTWYILSVLVILGLTACNPIKDVKADIANERHAKKLSKKIVEYINDDDVNGMKKLFSEYYQSNFELEEEIKYFFDSIDGKILSYEFKYYGEDGSVRDGKWTKQSSIIRLENIKTDLGKEYNISISEYLKYEDYKSKEGIYDLEVRNADRKRIASIYHD